MHKWNRIAKYIILHAECQIKYLDTKICITQDHSKTTNTLNINVSNYCSQHGKILG